MEGYHKKLKGLKRWGNQQSWRETLYKGLACSPPRVGDSIKGIFCPFYASCPSGSLGISHRCRPWQVSYSFMRSSGQTGNSQVHNEDQRRKQLLNMQKHWIYEIMLAAGGNLSNIFKQMTKNDEIKYVYFLLIQILFK